MTDRIGVFICECGPNIKDAVDIPALVRSAGQLDAVVLCETMGLLCSPAGRDQAARTIRLHNMTHVVFAGCSPREHEQTFRSILSSAGLNSFMLQTVNIREQCAWVIHDRTQATRKAESLIRGAVHRVRHHAPITIGEIDCCPDVLVIGAGVAGIGAARTLSQNGRRVFLVDRSPCIGGMAAMYEDLYPDFNCAACLIEPLLDDVLHDDRIEVLTLTEVTSVRGTPGNFTVAVKQPARYVDPDRCIGCAACLDVCPVTVPNEFNARMDTRTAVYIPYPGALPHVAVIDKNHCLRFKDGTCSACKTACPFDAVDYGAADTTRELVVGAVVAATGFQGFDPGRSTRYGFRTVDNVITAFAFERLVNTAGPTGGKIETADSRAPEAVAFVHCVGSRTDRFNRFCSGVCCLSAFKHGQQVKKQLPDTAVHHFFADLCLPGKTAQRFFEQVRDMAGVNLHRLARPDAIHISAENGSVIVQYTGASGTVHRVKVHLVVLATAMEPPGDAAQMARILDIELDDDGFFKEAHPVIDPVTATRAGVYLAGCSQAPKDIPASVAQGQAAAGRILQHLIPGEKMALEPIVARVDPDLCSGCRTCENLCPFEALDRDETGGPCMTVEATLCRGCGICAAACPGGAISIRHYSREAVYAEIAGLLKPGGN
ncbi:CoB--CoM heterodisulfide reductase iron-sulfur subunit A family protein [uncultured Desulfosarcina sp.]|uniref:CoB--CoM heterodisulfide reductase iron-sulfur subunit A family protein n=1 Tax=uncultured Desulfosarcina sp. TaxID=218289 RepID=UPI0029C8AD71|nr:CoB--CoM heterodisulfide reductase iron-sulfur subunit A family protein [uncultured Desulfosarcina sp.]